MSIERPIEFVCVFCGIYKGYLVVKKLVSSGY